MAHETFSESLYHHNFIRFWFLEHAWDAHSGTVISPHPWLRTGPGKALDGKPKFDVTRFDDVYFKRLRQRAAAAGNRGFYVSIMLFDDWSTENPGPWEGHPFHVSNNINGINVDLNNDGLGLEFHTLQIPTIIQLQEAYVRKVVDTVNDLDNIVYEIANETGISNQRIGSIIWSILSNPMKWGSRNSILLGQRLDGQS